MSDDNPFDISEWLDRTIWDGAVWLAIGLTAQESGAEHELDYYTDPAPYECFPQIMWSNPHYVGYKGSDGVVRVHRAGEEPPDIERVAKKVEQIAYTLTDLFDMRNRTT